MFYNRINFFGIYVFKSKKTEESVLSEWVAVWISAYIYAQFFLSCWGYIVWNRRLIVNEVIVACFGTVPGFPEGAEENQNSLIQDNLPLGWETNLGTPKYESEYCCTVTGLLPCWWRLQTGNHLYTRVNYYLSLLCSWTLLCLCTVFLCLQFNLISLETLPTDADHTRQVPILSILGMHSLFRTDKSSIQAVSLFIIKL